MSLLPKVGLVIFIMAMPFLVFTSAVRFVVNDVGLYHRGFEKYDIPSVTGIEMAELDRAARELVAYFNSGEEFVRIVLKTGEPLYNEKEVIHLKDVRDLVRFDYRLQLLTLAYVAAYTVVLMVRRARVWRRALPRLGRGLMYGGALTLAVMAAIGLAMLVAFDRVFLAFHLIGFSNLLWILDPATDRLIQMFPQGFFFDASLYLAGVTLGGALLVAVVGWGLGRAARRLPANKTGMAP